MRTNMDFCWGLQRELALEPERELQPEPELKLAQGLVLALVRVLERRERVRMRERGCWLAGGGWMGWGCGPSLTAAHSEAAPNPTPTTRQVRECHGLNCPADVRWQVVHAPERCVAVSLRGQNIGLSKVSATSVSLSGSSCTRRRRRQGVCSVAASECAAVSEGHGAYPLTAAALANPPCHRQRVPTHPPSAAHTYLPGGTQAAQQANRQPIQQTS